MTKYVLIVFLSSLFFSAESQNWDSVPGRFQAQLEGIIVDSIHDQLIVSSKFVSKVGNLRVRGIARWDGTHWDSLAGGINTDDKIMNPNNPGGEVYSGIPYNGKLLVGGSFNSVGDINATSLATWDGTKWDSLPQRAFKFGQAPGVSCLYQANNLIYIGGIFDTIAGQPTFGLATWNGANFQPVNLPLIWSRIYTIIEYKNEMYVAGNFSGGGTPAHYVDILRYNGTNWVELGAGLQGSTFVQSMAIYNDTLYVGGHFLKSDGNIGENIMKWDGNQWHDVGFGGEQIGSVGKLLVYHNTLWAFGNYETAAYMPAYRAACYDGQKWCTPKDSLDNGINSAVIFRDTVYVAGGFWSAGGDSSISYIAKLKDPDLFRGCNATGISEIKLSQSIKIYPNPTAAVLTIDDEQNDLQGSTIEVINYLGQTVLSMPYAHTVNISALSAGYYTLKISPLRGQGYYAKFIKD